MTDTNDTAYTEITWELAEKIDDLRSLLDINNLENATSQDMEKITEITNIYGRILLDQFDKIAHKVYSLEQLYKASLETPSL